jgi:hypothetical protein
MSFKDLSRIDAPKTVQPDEKLKNEPETKSPATMPIEGAPGPKKS